MIKCTETDMMQEKQELQKELDDINKMLTEEIKNIAHS